MIVWLLMLTTAPAVVPVPPFAMGRVPVTSAVSDTGENAGFPAALPCKSVVVVPWFACCALASVSVVQAPSEVRN